MKNFEIKPFAKPVIVDVRLTMPKLRRQFALNLQMIQLQFDCVDVLGKIPAYVSRADVQSDYSGAVDSRLDHHSSP